MKKSILYIASSLLFLTGCKKEFEKTNISPNLPITAPTELIMSSAQVTSILFYEGEMARAGDIWSGCFSGEDRQYAGLGKYVTTASDYDGAWSNAYRGVFGQCLLIEDAAAKINNRTQLGIAQVMRAQIGGTLTSLWGDIPYKEAGNYDAYPSPKFDRQQDVYASVQILLDSAIANLNANVGINPGGKDVFYGGDRTAWLSAAYSLKARFFLHTKNYQKAYDNALLGISDPGGDMNAPHGITNTQDFNIYYAFTNYDRSGYMAGNSLAAELLDSASPKYRGNAKTNEGSRFNFYYLKDQGNYNSGYELNFLCADFGFPAGYSENGFFGAESKFPLITYAETKLIAAEAAIRLGNFNNALSALNAHRNKLSAYIPTSYQTGFGFQYDALVTSDFNAGGLLNPGTLAPADALLKEIILERYCTLIGQMEHFNDIRRTKNAIGLTPTIGTKIPQRYYYPQQEINTNKNTPVQSSADLFAPTPVNQ